MIGIRKLQRCRMFIAGVVLALPLISACSGSSNDRDPSLIQKEVQAHYTFSTFANGHYAMLDWTAGPSGQITGKCVNSFLDDYGDPGSTPKVVRDTTRFTGQEGNGKVRFNGLLDDGDPVHGVIKGSTLTVDHTFPVANYKWKATTVDAFNKTIKDYAKAHPLPRQTSSIGATFRKTH
ncbi:hypothetical protein ACFV3R_23275 [Streptomyces sp. NPDC059740]|uniref:hypothetical protein n=1 Tax=Streptomyces sp. NPDC059740 TaxID=3346926 RepID=UPI00365274F2